MLHDGVSHHPLGGASYLFSDNLVRYISAQCPRPRIALHIGTQPNSSPHIGNLITFTSAFALAAALRDHHARDVVVTLVYVDTAPAAVHDDTRDGVRFQRSLSDTGVFAAHRPVFDAVLARLSALSGVACGVETQALWRRSGHFVRILQRIIERREVLGPHLSPKTGLLAIRAACPAHGCGLADKHGVRNGYDTPGVITFICPVHGAHTVVLASGDVHRLGFNTPLRNLIRVLICSRDEQKSWVMCTGSDYAGFYQEQLLWRLLDEPSAAPLILYAPLVLDWSGAKLSKSLYVAHGAYEYLREAGLAYMLEPGGLLAAERGMEALYEEVASWIAESYRFFRHYSLEYLHKQLTERGMRAPPGLGKKDEPLGKKEQGAASKSAANRS